MAKNKTFSKFVRIFLEQGWTYPNARKLAKKAIKIQNNQ